VLNISEIAKVFQVKDYELLKFDTHYEDLDFSELVESDRFAFEIDNFSNFKVDLEFVDGKKFAKSSFKIKKSQITQVAERCHEILYDKYEGTQKASFGYVDYRFHNYILVVKKKDKYMFVNYCVDNATCAGFMFSLITKVFDTIKELWSKLDDKMKCDLLKQNLPKIKDNVIIPDTRSESDADD